MDVLSNIMLPITSILLLILLGENHKLRKELDRTYEYISTHILCYENDFEIVKGIDRIVYDEAVNTFYQDGHEVKFLGFMPNFQFAYDYLTEYPSIGGIFCTITAKLDLINMKNEKTLKYYKVIGDHKIEEINIIPQ